MRGIAILSMVEIHFLLHVRPSDEWIYTVMASLGSLAAPFFLLCAGMGVGYMQQRYQTTASDIKRVLLRRGLFLIVFTSILGSSYHMDITRAVDWDIFTVIGVMYLVVAVGGGIRLEATLVSIILVLLVNQFLPTSSPAILRGGSFPIIPFAAYFLFGVLFAQICHLPNQKNVGRLAMMWTTTIFLVIVRIQGLQAFYLTRYDVWSFSGVIGISALFLTLLNVTRLLQHHYWITKIGMPVVKLGNVSFSLYYMQFFLLIIIPILFEMGLGKEILIILPTTVWFVFLIALFGILYVVVLVWAHFGYKFSLEWLMNKYISERSQFTS